MKNSLLTLFCVLFIQIVSAQTKEESIKELMVIMHQDQLIDKTFNSVMPVMHKQMQKQFAIESSKASDELFEYTMELSAGMTKRLINSDMVDIYGKLFNQTEINDLIAFYKTASGQKVLTVMPEMQKLIINVIVTKYVPELQEKIKKKASELKSQK